MTAVEVWRPVPGWQNYYHVSSLGRVKSLARVKDGRWGPKTQPVGERILKPAHNTDGYLMVAFQANGIRRNAVMVHQIVLEAFVGPRPDGYHACHNDGSRTNNAVENLRWDTPSANIRDSVRMGTQMNTRKTHCPAGHPYDQENTHRNRRGARRCRACSREKARLRDRSRGRAA